MIWPVILRRIFLLKAVIFKYTIIITRVFQIGAESNIVGIRVWNKKIMSGFETDSGLKQSLINI